MYIFVTILIFIVCILLILIVQYRTQKEVVCSKLTGNTQTMGVRKTPIFLKRQHGH